MSQNIRKEIKIVLFDEHLDTITADKIYWVHQNTLFPFERVPFNEDDYKIIDEIEQILSLSNSKNKCEILARILKAELQKGLDAEYESILESGQ